jgi:hypothetical protein
MARGSVLASLFHVPRVLARGHIEGVTSHCALRFYLDHQDHQHIYWIVVAP